MILHRLARLSFKWGLVASVAIGLSACGGGFSSGDSGLFKRNRDRLAPADTQYVEPRRQNNRFETRETRRDGKSSILSLFANNADPNVTVDVNKYIWAASLDVLNFLPIESVDPFTGVIVTGYGRPPGSGRAYRATVLIQDPALDARSLKLALQSQGGGAVAPETVRAVEDAILSRARQLRIQDSRL